MIIDVSGIVLVPGICGEDCPGSWENAGIDCCCDECDYMMCCLETHNPEECRTCEDQECPHSLNSNNICK